MSLAWIAANSFHAVGLDEGAYASPAVHVSVGSIASPAVTLANHPTTDVARKLPDR